MNDAGPSTTTAGKKLEKPIPTWSEDTRRWLESGAALANVVAGPSGPEGFKVSTSFSERVFKIV